MFAGGLVALAAVLFVYHCLPARAQAAWLLLCSYLFYSWWALQFTPVLAAMTLATHVCATRIAVQRDRGRKERSRAWLIAGVALIVAMLAALRAGYRDAPFEGPFAVLGISFYSLQAIAYLSDCYSGILRNRHSLGEVALYLAYFPKLVAGPIERPQPFFAQLAGPRVVDDARLARAVTLIAIGAIRKLAIADPLRALLPLSASSGTAEIGTAAALVGYMFVIYNDFAGYTCIARGVSLLFGIELSRNFDVPFAAHSFSNLWSRWHVSFSLWLRDYVYLPISRYLLLRDLRRNNFANVVVPPLVTMLVCGLWHGTNLHMLAWGGAHGLFLIVERVGGLVWPPPPGRVLPRWRRVVGIAVVFSVSCLTLAAFRLPIDQAWGVWQQLLPGGSGGLGNVRLVMLMIPSLWLDWMQLRHGDETMIAHWPRIVRAAALAGAILICLAAAASVSPAPFVYQGF